MKIIININDRLAKFVQKMCTTRNMVFAVAMVLFCAGLFIFSESVNIPNQLHEGDLIVAEELNENFQALRDRDLDSLVDVDTGGAADGNVLQFDGADWVPSTFSPTGVWATSGSDIYFNGGNIGIGTASPGANLEVRGNIQAWETDMDAIQGRTANGTGIYGSSNNGCGVYAHSGSSSAPALQAIQDGGGDIFQLKNTVSTVMVVDSTGNVGIGTTSPDGKLHVFSGDASGLADPDGDELTLENSGHSGMCIISGTTSRGNIYFKDGWENRGAIQYNHNGDYMDFITVGSEKVRIDSNGNVGIGTTNPNYRLQVGETSNYGWVNTDGSWGSSSDVRQKENIKDMSSGLDKILAMRSVSYNTIGSDPEKEDQIGFIAQEVEEIVPEIVSTDREGYKGIAYAKLTPLLVKAIQEQQELIEELKAEIAELKNK